MILTTRVKILGAKLLSRGLIAIQRLRGGGRVVLVRRHGIEWELDLGEGIDLAVFLFGRFESATVDVCMQFLKPGAIVVDIGTNVGAYALPFAQAVGAAGKIFAFEPSFHALDRLKRNLALNPVLAKRIETHQFFLTSTAGASVPSKVWSSWPLVEDSGTDRLHGGRMEPTFGARADTLDSVLARAEVTRLDLIKLDVDGYELEVLAGAIESLRRFRPAVIFEMAPYMLTARGARPDELPRMLSSFGYRFEDLKGNPISDLEALAGIKPGRSRNIVALSR